MIGSLTSQSFSHTPVPVPWLRPANNLIIFNYPNFPGQFATDYSITTILKLWYAEGRMVVKRNIFFLLLFKKEYLQSMLQGIISKFEHNIQ